jgi:hypothetical protein
MTSAGSGVVLYHGTRRPFTVGGLLVPRAVHGGPGTTAPLNPGCSEQPDAANFVYLTDDVTLAWVYAWHAPGRGRPRVLTVAPLGTVERDPEHSWRSGAWRCEAARVTAVDLTPSITEADARSGWVLHE